ncbi:PaaI family thioesterase [Cytobacillus sp. FSL R5-0569]|uniref:PaaI family thioesterase n=1 Tax=Cytobacillus sp. FSL R5-0569 TaxID=2921649 RepID=UPI0030F88E14
MSTKLEELKKMADGKIPGSPASQIIGFQVKEVELGRVLIELEATKKLHNPMGTLHGGILCDIADAAMGYAFATTLDDDELFSTVEIKLNFLKPVFHSRLIADGKLIKKGSTTGLLECHIYDEKGGLVAHLTSTCMIIKGKVAHVDKNK